MCNEGEEQWAEEASCHVVTTNGFTFISWSMDIYFHWTLWATPYISLEEASSLHFITISPTLMKEGDEHTRPPLTTAPTPWAWEGAQRQWEAMETWEYREKAEDRAMKRNRLCQREAAEMPHYGQPASHYAMHVIPFSWCHAIFTR